MGRLLTLMMLMILGALAVRTQPPSPYSTRTLLNGLAWRENSFPAKLMFVNGAVNGYLLGSCEVMVYHKLNCKADPSIPAWINANPTAGDTTKEIDSFYDDGANISIPIIQAFEYSQMKLAGATKEKLDSYLKAIR